MPRPLSPHQEKEESPIGIDPRYAALVPLLNALAWILAMAVRAGIVPRHILDRPVNLKDKNAVRRNRQLRRARASCLRRARRCALKHGRVNPADYTPRAYAHAAYVAMMPKHYTAGQFYEHYLKDNALSRAQVYGLTAAHHIAACTRDLCASVSGIVLNALGIFTAVSTEITGISDPAPP